jgi:hypothetical protein
MSNENRSQRKTPNNQSQRSVQSTEFYLAVLEDVDARITATTDTKYLEELRTLRTDLQHGLATSLHSEAFPYRVGDRILTLHWKVEGVPSKNKREEAFAWMAARGLEWNGFAPTLCKEVLKGPHTK